MVIVLTLATISLAFLIYALLGLVVLAIGRKITKLFFESTHETWCKDSGFIFFVLTLWPLEVVYGVIALTSCVVYLLLSWPFAKIGETRLWNNLVIWYNERTC